MGTAANIQHIDSILSGWRDTIGPDYDGYHNHVIRMTTFCLLLAESQPGLARPCNAEEQQKIEIAACFHDIGIWTDNTLDYLAPSVPPARDYLEAKGLEKWATDIEQMIMDHHKLRDASSPLVELFRKGDLVDFSLGSVRFGLSRQVVKQVKTEFPNAGFHQALARIASRWLVKHPFNPLPMMKW